MEKKNHIFQLLLIFPISVLGEKVTKCCPLDQVLSSDGCVNLPAGLSLPKVRIETNLVSFSWLKDQNKLKTGIYPSCLQQEEVYPDFTETAADTDNVPHFSEDGVFIHELKYFRPGHYCVDGELDTDDYYEADAKDSVIYEKVVLCEEKSEAINNCNMGDKNCYSR